jgi:diaminopimelate epimerase
MFSINFGKLHGFGNDYIVIEAEDLQRGASSLENFARKVCHRNTGIGGDGIAVLERLENGADYSCRIINPDGSEAGFSGNGTRCAVAYLYYKNLWSGKNLRLKTRSGIKNYQFLERERNTFWFRAELGKPSAITNYEIRITKYEKPLSVLALDVGNPVAAIFTRDFDDFDWRAIGRAVETHEQFPERTNVVFIKVVDEENVEIRIWERGAGETASSGTCSISAAVASAYTDKTGRKVFVHAEGGTTEAVWREDGEMLITGRADLVFCGKWFESD